MTESANVAAEMRAEMSLFISILKALGLPDSSARNFSIQVPTALDLSSDVPFKAVLVVLSLLGVRKIDARWPYRAVSLLRKNRPAGRGDEGSTG